MKAEKTNKYSNLQAQLQTEANEEAAGRNYERINEVLKAKYQPQATKKARGGAYIRQSISVTATELALSKQLQRELVKRNEVWLNRSQIYRLALQALAKLESAQLEQLSKDFSRQITE